MVLRLTLCDRLGRVPWELSITDSFLQFANISRVQQSLSTMTIRERKYFMFRRASVVTGNVSFEHIIYSCKNNSGHCHQKIRNLVFGNALDKRYKSFIQWVAPSMQCFHEKIMEICQNHKNIFILKRGYGISNIKLHFWIYNRCKINSEIFLTVHIYNMETQHKVGCFFAIQLRFTRNSRKVIYLFHIALKVNSLTCLGLSLT